jgi:alkylation response protein AidB-like acyl-CoA dehydrogenase
VERTLFDDEHRWFRETAAGFVARELLPHRDAHRAQRRIPAEVWRRAGEQGLLGLGAPAEHGGSGVADFRFNAVLGEELVRAGLAYGSAFAVHNDVVGPYLIHLTSEEQRARWLPGYCAGKLIAAIAMTEPGAGSDLRGLRSEARRAGEDWILNGSKTFITNGIGAGLVVVAARAPEGITLFAVEEGMEGFARGRKLDKIGQHEADTAELFFQDVRVPAANVIGTVGRGFEHMTTHLAQERLGSAVLNLAHARLAVEATLDYVRERRAFGRPIGRFQHSRFVLADLATELDVGQAFIDRCLLEHVAGRLTPVEAAQAKLWTSEVQSRVVDACVQLHGGYGYMAEYEVARAWADARVTKVWAGANEVMREIIGRSMGLGEPRP